MCGKSSELSKARIEETFLRVCRFCARLGEIIKEEPVKEAVKTEEMRFVEIIPQFSAAIKEARKQKKLSLKELALQIKEKESVIKRTENGMRPTNVVAKKLEKALGIQLLGYTEARMKLGPLKSEPLTVGDVLEIRMRKRA